MNIADLFVDSVRRHASKTAVMDAKRAISYAELLKEIDSLSELLHRYGMRKNYRVAVLLPNGMEFIRCFFSLLRLNAIVAPLSPDSTAFELERIFNNLKPHAVVSLLSTINKLNAIAPYLLEEKIVIAHDGNDTRFMGDIVPLGFRLSEDKVGDNAPAKDAADAIATISYTYRGTGYPLGSLLTHKSYQRGIEAYIETTRVSCKHNVVSILPVHYMYPLVGCILAPLVSGATVVISRNYMPRSIFKLIYECNINYLTIVPTLYRMLLQHYHKSVNIRSLTCCITGGSYMDESLIRSISSTMGLEVLQGYGLTECFVVSWNRQQGNRIGTLGLPFGGNVQIKIVDERGLSRPPNQVGEIEVKSDALAMGYYQNSMDTQKVLSEGWFRTGDLGYLDEDGYLHFSGVKKNIAKVGGNMVDLEEVREVMLRHPAIDEVGVFAKDDSLWGHVIEANIVQGHHVNELSIREIRSFCAHYLSLYKIPSAVHRVREAHII